MKVSYCIATDSNRKSDTLYLWREQKSMVHKVAKFNSKVAAELFAKEFDFPLSDSVLAIFAKSDEL